MIDELAGCDGAAGRAGLRLRVRGRPPRGALRPRHRGGRAGRRPSGSAFARTACVNDDPVGDRRAGRPGASATRRELSARRRGRRRGHHRPGRRWRARPASDPSHVDVVSRGDATGSAASCSASPFAGLPAVDEGADAFLARVPEGAALADELGLGSDARLTRSPAGMSCRAAAACTRFPRPGARRARRPRRARPSRLLSLAGQAARRARPRPAADARPTHDSLGPARSATGSATRCSNARRSARRLDQRRRRRRAQPRRVDAADRRGRRANRSLLLGLRSSRRPRHRASGPVFLAPRGGMGSLAITLAERLAAAACVCAPAPLSAEIDRGRARLAASTASRSTP